MNSDPRRPAPTDLPTDRLPAVPPQVQAWRPAQVPQQWAPPYYPQPPPAVQPASTTNVAATISLVCGLLALLILPILLGPAAIISGFVGVSLSSKRNGVGGRMGSAGIVLGILTLLVGISGLRAFSTL